VILVILSEAKNPATALEAELAAKIELDSSLRSE
jgi:hypothetical protein